MQEFAPTNPPPAPPAEHWPGDAELAAYIDGTLGEAESRRIAEHLADCDECSAVYIGTLQFQLESEPDAVVVAFPSKTESRPQRWWAAVAAALVAFLAGGGWYAFQSARLGPAPSLAVADLLPPSQKHGPLWDHAVFRGSGGGVSGFDAETRDRHSFQIGALLVDFQLSAQAGDFVNGSEVRRTIGRTLRQVDLMQQAGDRFLAEAGEIVDLASLRRVAARAEPTEEKLAGEESLLSPEYLSFGKWTEAGRIAAATSNRAFFKSLKNRRFLSYVLRGRDIRPRPATRRTLVEIAEIWDQGRLGSADLKALEQRFNSILDEFDFTS